MPVPVSATDAGLTTRTDRFAALSSHSRTAPYPRSQSFFCGIRQQQLKENWKAVEKHCTAVVHGSPAGKSGTFASYLAEDADQFVHSTADETRGKWSETLYRVVGETPRFSLLDITLLTGRKNQIRVHLAEAGHPVAGDAKYGKKGDRIPRLALHARTLSFPHPHDGRPLAFEAPVPAAILGLVEVPA